MFDHTISLLGQMRLLPKNSLLSKHLGPILNIPLIINPTTKASQQRHHEQ
jgi:hypothetical protein